MLNPDAWPIATIAFQYGPPVLLAALGLYLLARDGSGLVVISWIFIVMVLLGGAAWYFLPVAQDTASRSDSSSDALFNIGGAKNTTVENNRIVGDIGNRSAFNIHGNETTIVRGNGMRCTPPMK
jgi:hypothetical protein